MKTVFLILKEDIVYYPPVLSIINVLLELNVRVVHIGVYSDKEQKRKLEEKGVRFLPTQPYNGQANLFLKLKQQLRFKTTVISFLNQFDVSSDDVVWLFQSETFWLLESIVSKYNTILHPFEFTDPNINWKYRLINPLFDMGKVMRKAKKVVCCEYNRAQITKGLFELKELPIVLPNKPFFDDEEIKDIPLEVSRILEKVDSMVQKRKIILYQGVFTKDRSLDEFCSAMDFISEDYVLLLMGKPSRYYDELNLKYSSDRILFLPFIKPPYHLLITQKAAIGILSYIPQSDSMASVINPLYCAPNKIFEYARYSIPMIANDVPGLHYIFLEYGCGKCIVPSVSPQSIADTVKMIQEDSLQFSKGAYSYYSSVDLKVTIKEIIEI